MESGLRAETGVADVRSVRLHRVGEPGTDEGRGVTTVEARPWYCENCLRHWADNSCDECGAFPLPLVKALEVRTASLNRAGREPKALEMGSYPSPAASVATGVATARAVFAASRSRAGTQAASRSASTTGGSAATERTS